MGSSALICFFLPVSLAKIRCLSTPHAAFLRIEECLQVSRTRLLTAAQYRCILPGADALSHIVQVHFRAMHDLPAGEELTQSYFPLNTSYQLRQQRCAEHYGFACTCPRCKVRPGNPAKRALCFVGRRESIVHTVVPFGSVYTLCSGAGLLRSWLLISLTQAASCASLRRRPHGRRMPMRTTGSQQKQWRRRVRRRIPAAQMRATSRCSC